MFDLLEHYSRVVTNSQNRLAAASKKQSVAVLQNSLTASRYQEGARAEALGLLTLMFALWNQFSSPTIFHKSWDFRVEADEASAGRTMGS
jgi:hypothetical protein